MGQSFVYDGFGNLTDKNITGTAPPYHTSFDTTHNWDNSVPYDKNGNQLATSTEFFGYDVENRMVTANPTGVEDVYGYGRGNRRVYAGHWQWGGSQYSLSGETVYFYSVTGQKLGTYQLHLNTAPPGPPSLTFTLQETRVWFGGRLVMLNGQTVTPDRLGSFGKYYPFGEDRGSGNPPGDREKFATYTRDSDTNLDYAVNRYYNNVSGRFLSADPHDGGTVTNPASWNHYAYAGGDPAGNMDPDGLDWCPAGASADVCAYMSGLPDDDPGGMCVETAWSFGYIAATAQCPNMAPGIYGADILMEAAMEGQLAQEAQQQDPCPGIAQQIWNTISGAGMPGGKSLLRRVVENIVGSSANYKGHDVQIQGYRGRLQNLKNDWKNNDCDDPDDPPYGTNTWINDTDPKVLRKYHDEYQQFVADLSKIATAGAAGAGYLAVQAAILWESVQVFLGSLPVPVP